MTVFQAVVLGIVQGLTEFFPVSSSGHLVIVQSWMGIDGPTLTFDVMLHFGTLVAVMIALKKDWLPVLTGAWRPSKDGGQGLRRLVLLFVGSLPVAVVGLVLKDVIEPLFSAPVVAGWMLLVTGAVLWFSHRRSETVDRPRGLNDITVADAFAVGVAQCLAILPGLSRSGATTGGGLWRGIEREAAARFSFLLAIPAILGATLLELPAVVKSETTDLIPMVVGTIVAALAGYGAITAFLQMMRRGWLKGFAIYTWILGVLVIVFI